MDYLEIIEKTLLVLSMIAALTPTEDDDNIVNRIQNLFGKVRNIFDKLRGR